MQATITPYVPPHRLSLLSREFELARREEHLRQQLETALADGDTERAASLGALLKSAERREPKRHF